MVVVCSFDSNHLPHSSPHPPSDARTGAILGLVVQEGMCDLLGLARFLIPLPWGSDWASRHSLSLLHSQPPPFDICNVCGLPGGEPFVQAGRRAMACWPTFHVGGSVAICSHSSLSSLSCSSLGCLHVFTFAVCMFIAAPRGPQPAMAACFGPCWSGLGGPLRGMCACRALGRACAFHP